MKMRRGPGSSRGEGAVQEGSPSGGATVGRLRKQVPCLPGHLLQRQGTQEPLTDASCFVHSAHAGPLLGL